MTEEMSSVREPSAGFWFEILEYLTAGVLLTVLAALAWMILAVYQPASTGWLEPESEVVVVLGLLTAALGLVSVVALLHTRPTRRAERRS